MIASTVCLSEDRRQPAVTVQLGFRAMRSDKRAGGS